MRVVGHSGDDLVYLHTAEKEISNTLYSDLFRGWGGKGFPTSKLSSLLCVC